MTGQWLAERTDGHSGDDLRRLTRELAFRVFRRFKRSPDGANALTRIDVDEVLASFKPTVTPEALEKFELYKN